MAKLITLLNHQVTPAIQTLEVSTSLQIPQFQIIGLPGPEVSEARDRVKSAVENSDFEFPRRKVIVNLSPSSVRKQGTGMDLAIALAVLSHEESFPDSVFAWGELGLEGQVKSTGFPFRALDAAFAARALAIFLPADDRPTLMLSPLLFAHLLEKHGLTRQSMPPLYWVTHLREAHEILENRRKKRSWPKAEETLRSESPQRAKSASRPLPGVNLGAALQKTVGIASAGFHHLFLVGPRGAGKSLAVEWLLALSPETPPSTQLDRRLLTELRGDLVENEARILRRVGVQVRPQHLYGGIHSGVIRPGEFSLAHGGLLVADELPEWARDSRESFREPLERKRITLSRAGQTVELLADFQLAATGNLCPCGGEASSHTPHLSLRCRCLDPDRRRYLARVSGPILDRIDLVVRVEAARKKPAPGLAPSAFVEKVQKVRSALLQRHGVLPGKMESDSLETFLENHPRVREALDELSFASFRDRQRLLRIGLTIAEWNGDSLPGKAHFLEAQILRDALSPEQPAF